MRIELFPAKIITNEGKTHVGFIETDHGGRRHAAAFNICLSISTSGSSVNVVTVFSSPKTHLCICLWPATLLNCIDWSLMFRRFGFRLSSPFDETFESVSLVRHVISNGARLL